MSVKDFIYNLITTDSVMNTIGINDDSTFLTHTVDTPQVRPLCILRWQAVNRGLAVEEPWPVNQRVLQVWVHDDLRRGDFDRIDQALKRVRAILEPLAGINVGDDSEWLSCVYWEGDSDDLNDSELSTLSRNAQFRFTGRGI
jgi:hypothetical protein